MPGTAIGVLLESNVPNRQEWAERFGRRQDQRRWFIVISHFGTMWSHLEMGKDGSPDHGRHYVHDLLSDGLLSGEAGDRGIVHMPLVVSCVPWIMTLPFLTILRLYLEKIAMQSSSHSFLMGAAAFCCALRLSKHSITSSTMLT